MSKIFIVHMKNYLYFDNILFNPLIESYGLYLELIKILRESQRNL